MKTNPYWTAALTALVMAGLFLSQTRSRTQDEVDPAIGPIEYRTGVYLPEDFPLGGTVRLLSPPVAEAGQRSRIKIEYTVGDTPVEPGMSLEIWKHFTSDVEQFQVEDARAPAHFSVEFPEGEVTATTRTFSNWTRRNNPSVFPYRKAAGVTIDNGSLVRGSRVLFDLGGEVGVRMQHYEENLFNFRVAIVRDRKVLGYGGDAILKINGGPVRKLRVRAPSIVGVRERFSVEVVPLDAWGSLGKDYLGLDFRIAGGSVVGGTFRYDPSLMHYIARDVMATSLGTERLLIESVDGRFRSLSNPVWVERSPNRRVYYGELHQHSYLQDGRGVFSELFLYGRRVGLLDFASITPHHAYIRGLGPFYYLDNYDWRRNHWPEMQRVNRKMNGWQGLVTIPGYEYSVSMAMGGHHNVYYNADEAPTQMDLDPIDKERYDAWAQDRKKPAPMADIAKMIRQLRGVKKPTLVIPHIGGGPPDWKHATDPRMERLFEIASVHGVFEESYFKHLETGLRLGAIAAGDVHTTSMGSAYPGLIYTMTNGLTAVYAHGKSRDEIWDGLYGRHTFAVTGNNRMLLGFWVNGEPMGGELASGLETEARVKTRISATSPIVRVDLLKNLQTIYSAHPARPSRGGGDQGSTLLRVVWGDNYYQRRANVGLASGTLLPEKGSLELREVINRDQAFEHVAPLDNGVHWTTAAVSGDRDGFLVDISKARGDALLFRLEDPQLMGTLEVAIPLDELRQNGHFTWTQLAPAERTHPYMLRLGLRTTFSLECELVSENASMDFEATYLDKAVPKSGDFYQLRVEQLDTNKAWSSPVWVN